MKTYGSTDTESSTGYSHCYTNSVVDFPKQTSNLSIYTTVFFTSDKLHLRSEENKQHTYLGQYNGQTIILR